ncbi:chaplin [Streptomyces sp. SCSIO 30461]|uniref:chaplin n=1 Tax=Streptomyces sp. SCSIO 30461 TaxID=3118085 RepID=UPI0030CD9484
MFRLVKSAVVALAVGAATIGGASVASADAGAQGVAADSPGILSGNVIQVPIDVPIAACGNSLGVIGMLNGTAGNTCLNGDMTDGDDGSTGAMAVGAASGSPGILSGNVIQVPVSVPVAMCGNSLGVISMLSPAAGNACVNS